MPFSNAPTNDTYSTHRVPFAYPLKIRPSNNNLYPLSPGALQAQDEGMVNYLPIQGDETIPLYGETRPGLDAIFINSSAENSLVRGMYVWEKTAGTTYSFIVCGTKVYSAVNIDSSFTGVNWTQVNTLLTSATTPVRFTEFIDATNVKKLVLVDGVEGYVFTSNAAGTKITDVDFPTPHIPFPVFLDGRLYLAKANTGDIYNSDLNDPAAWTAGNFISTEVYPDDVQAIVKVNNYLLAIGLHGSEFYYDAGNATGTPLARQDSAVLPFGTSFPNSIAVNDDTVVLLANSLDGQSSFKVIEGFKHADLTAPGILTQYYSALNNPYTSWSSSAVAAASCRGSFFRVSGELYYTFLYDGTRLGTFSIPSVNFCYSYSFKTKAWTEFQYGSDTTSRLNRWTFPMFFTSFNTTGNFNTYICGNIGSTGMAFFGRFNETSGSDVIQSLTSQAIYQETRLPNIDFGTLNQKFMSRMAVVAECGDSTLNPALKIRWNDNDYDYLAWSSEYSLNTGTADYWPFITQMGRFRRRAVRVYTTSAKPMTGRYIEFDINKGQQ